VLLPQASALREVEADLRAGLSTEARAHAVDLLPDVWLAPAPPFETPAARRAAYVDYLEQRLGALPQLLEEAARARAELV
jgi:hypothetical protein